MQKTYDLNEEQLDLIRNLVNRWVIELDDTDKWADEYMPEVMQQDMHDKVKEARDLAVSVQEVFNDH